MIVFINISFIVIFALGVVRENSIVLTITLHIICASPKRFYDLLKK